MSPAEGVLTVVAPVGNNELPYGVLTWVTLAPVPVVAPE
jgi:hypothetical protein